MKRHAGLFFITIIVICLEVLGIQWGIPKDAYRRFYYKDGNVPVDINSITEEYVKKSWEKSRLSLEEGKIPRSVFNILRSFHPDEHNILKSISNMNPHSMDFNPHFFEYPSFLIYFTAFLLLIASLLGMIKVTSDISFYFMNPGEMGKFFLLGRSGVVFLSILGVILLYKTAENFFDRKTALLSSFMLGITPLYMLNSHFMTVDIPMVFWIIVALYLFSLFWKNNRVAFFYMASIALGFAAGTKYPAVFIWLMIPLMYAGKKEKVKAIFYSVVVKALLLATIIFFFTTPYAILSFNEFKRDLLYQVTLRGFAKGFSLKKRFCGFLTNSSLVMISGCSLLSVFFFAGIVYAIIKKGKEKLFLAGLLFAFIPLLLTGGFKYARYYLIVLPFMIVLAASFISAFSENKYGKSIFTKAVFMVALFVPCLKSFSYAIHMNGKDVRIDAAEFIDTNIPFQSRIVFTRDPWVFEVPPVNRYNYNMSVVEIGDGLLEVEQDSYLVVGELQYFLAYGSRIENEKILIKKIEDYGYTVERVFRKFPHIFNITFDTDKTVHDIIYTHPAIYLFKKT